VKEINAPKGRVSFDCVCAVGDTVVVEGHALVKVPSREAPAQAPAEPA